MTTSTSDSLQRKPSKRPNTVQPETQSQTHMHGLTLTAGLIQRAQQDPSALSAQDVMSLQRTIGNRAVSSMLQRSNIRAFTNGNHIYYGQGQSPSDLQLTAHEAVHTMQQGAKPALQRKAAPVYQRWAFKKDPNREGKSFAKPKQYKDPKFLKKNSRRKDKGVPVDAPVYQYDSGTDTVKEEIQNRKGPIYLDTVGDIEFETRTVNGKEQKGFIHQGALWVPKSSIGKVGHYYHNLAGRDLTRKTGQKYLEILDDGTTEERDEFELPKPEDVIQSQIGDCYLEAALISIAATDPEYILGMLRDNGGTVTVRLYEVNRRDPKNPTFKPRYIKVNKSEVRYRNRAMYQEGHVWVAMIQKAYAAGGFTGQGTRKSGGSKKANSFNSIAGGHSHRAFEVLLGKPAIQYKVDSGKAQNHPKMSALPWSPAEIQNHQWIAKLTGNYGGLVSYNEIFGQDTDKVDRWMKWAKRLAIQHAIDALFMKKRGLLGLMGVQKGLKFKGHKLGYQREVRLEDFRDLFEKKDLDGDLVEPVMGYLQKFFPGKLGTHQYTDRQIEIFDQIQSALDEGRFVNAGTPEVVGRTSTGKGHSAGEDQSKGIVGSHAYAVLGADLMENTGARLIKLRNPWGRYGRYYTKETDNGPLKPTAGEQANDATFELDLADFTKRFTDFQISSTPDPKEHVEKLLNIPGISEAM